LEKKHKTSKIYTNWQFACFQWNVENDLIDDDIDEYFAGTYDERMKNVISYVPSTQLMPEKWNNKV